MAQKLRRARLKAEHPLAEMYTPQAWDGFSRVDLMSFVERAFAEVDRAHPFSPNWHLELMCSRLQAMAQGKNRRQIINVPPRSLKSICASVALVAWILGHDPTKRVMVVSYGQDLADKLARDTRQVMQSAWYRRMFPQAALSPVRSAVSDFDTVAGGGRMATSFGGAITGRGCDFILIDDAIKPDEVLSARSRQAVNEYVASTLRSRFNNQMQGSILVVMQRLHEEDLSGHLLAAGGWAHLNLPAIAEVDESWSFATPFGLRRASRSAGEALHPEHMDLQVLGELKADMGAYLFAAQYQQRPAPAGGGLVRLEQFGRYALADLPTKFDQVIQRAGTRPTRPASSTTTASAPLGDARTGSSTSSPCTVERWSTRS